MATRGDGPGWIHAHRATLVSPTLLRVTGGNILSRPPQGQQAEEWVDNQRVYHLDLLRWRAGAALGEGCIGRGAAKMMSVPIGSR